MQFSFWGIKHSLLKIIYSSALRPGGSHKLVNSTISFYLKLLLLKSQIKHAYLTQRSALARSQQQTY